MTTTQTSADEAAVRRFRAPTVAAALADARAELGDVEIVEANRIRRGGVGGFFATDLGVELVVRAAGGGSSSSDGRRDGAVDVADPDDREYVDSACVERLTPERQLPRARVTDDRPQFYDRDREDDRPSATRSDAVPDESITAELERLLTTAARAEQLRAGRERTFSSHLTEQLGRAEDDPPPRADQAHRPTLPSAPLEHPAQHPVPATSEAPPTQKATPAPTPTPTAAAAPAAKPARRGTSRSGTGGDPWRKSIDLAAGAAGRLVEQLSDVTPVEGSRMQTLSRLTVSVTTPDGAVILLTAELERDT